MIRFSLEFEFLLFTAASYQETRHFVGCLFSLSRVIMPTVKSYWTSNASHIVKIRLIVCGFIAFSFVQNFHLRCGPAAAGAKTNWEGHKQT